MDTTPTPTERPAVVHQDGWAGRTQTPVMVIGETPKRYRVRWLQGSYRRAAGDVTLVPKYAVTFTNKEGQE